MSEGEEGEKVGKFCAPKLEHIIPLLKSCYVTVHLKVKFLCYSAFKHSYEETQCCSLQI
jgi:hypothetical protein